MAAAATSASHVDKAAVRCREDLRITTPPAHETRTPVWLFVPSPPRPASGHPTNSTSLPPEGRRNPCFTVPHR
eukprot:1186360-Pyramimonas_sp.AAC.1